jgi:hypothetical protein
MVLLPLLVVLPLLGLILLVWGNAAVDRLLITKIRSDLAVAQGYFERVLGEVGASTRRWPSRPRCSRRWPRPAADLVALLRRFKQRERLDFINLRAPDGTLRVTDSGPARTHRPRSPALPPPAATTAPASRCWARAAGAAGADAARARAGAAGGHAQRRTHRAHARGPRDGAAVQPRGARPTAACSATCRAACC